MLIRDQLADIFSYRARELTNRLREISYGGEINKAEGGA